MSKINKAQRKYKNKKRSILYPECAHPKAGDHKS